MSAFNTFMDAADRAQLKVSNRRQDSASIECPVHDDKSPSMSVKYVGGKVLIHCHGCGADVRDIIAALNLTMEDLFDEEPDRDKNNVLVARYDYVDPNTGEVVFFKSRYFPKTFRIGHYDKAGLERPGFPKGQKPWLFHAPELKAALTKGDPIWVVEGEADVLSMEKMGAVATTQPHGAGPGKWLPFHTALLQRASEVRIVVDLDADGPGGKNIGRDYAFEVRSSLAAAGVKATLWKPRSGKDATDHLKAGHDLSEFRRYDLGKERVSGITGADLHDKEFPPLIYAVEGILPQGLAILAGSPKAGKSFVALDIAVGVGSGGICLSGLRCTPGDVLYIGLEDSERRLKSRIDLLNEGHWPDLSRIEFQTIDSGWTGGDQGVAWMEEWALEVDSPRLIVIDTLGKAEPSLDEQQNRYLAEQAMMLKYKRFADRHDLTVLFVHHNRKAADETDWLNALSGSKGITGGADTLLYIDFKRGERDGLLRVEGRDVEADDVPITKPRGRPFWKAIAAPKSLEEEVWVRDPNWEPNERQRAILDVLAYSEKRVTVLDLNREFPDEAINEDLGELVRMKVLARGPNDEIRLA